MINKLEKLIKKRLQYNQDTGDLIWTTLPRFSRKKVGEPVRTLDGHGYYVVCVDKNYYRAHRVAWFLYYGSWPKHHLDHINGCRTDNKILNLREASVRENGQNMKIHRNGRLVGTLLKNKKWSSRISIKNKKIHLGVFSTEEEAHIMYLLFIETIEKVV